MLLSLTKTKIIYYTKLTLFDLCLHIPYTLTAFPHRKLTARERPSNHRYLNKMVCHSFIDRFSYTLNVILRKYERCSGCLSGNRPRHARGAATVPATPSFAFVSVLVRRRCQRERGLSPMAVQSTSAAIAAASRGFCRPLLCFRAASKRNCERSQEQVPPVRFLAYPTQIS